MRNLLLLIVLGAFISAGKTCWAEIPHLINYQGMLTDDQGQPYSGNYKLKFSIYAVSTGGTALWSELHLGIPVEDGLFNALLGMNKPIPDSVFDEPERFLGIKVGTYSELSPRIQLTSAGYAYRANIADFAQEAETDNDWTISGNNMYSAVSGSVGIGTEDPAQKLDVDGNVKVRGNALEVVGGAGSYVKVGTPHLGYSTTFSYQSDGSMCDTYISNPCGLGIGCDLILDFPFGNVGIGTTSPKAKLHSTHSTIVGAAASEADDNDMGSSQVNIWVDEANNRLCFKVKYSDGTTIKSVCVDLQ